ncbi:MAG: nucleoside monophosphate kinase [Bacilli bacterium]|nr:nucleoside monophosphate kinase [Bacilli bacterium]
MICVILGGPASGKGTRAKILCEKLGIPHISTGELLRKVAEENDEIREKLANGNLISDDFTTALLYSRLTKEDCLNGCVIDGYPRTLNQAFLLDDMLEKLGTKLDGVIQLTVSDEVVFERILGRSECSVCGKIYGSNIKPRIVNICDSCGGTLVKRSDDNEETVRNRINIYKEKSKHIIDYYKGDGLVVSIDASSNPENVLSVIDLF